ncbi:AAA family ATPase [Desulfogranum japonicum]|uniref:AAA family ATPase n=1 Tax=Desulfogranum japonicum TaxID=231447 RepID=UPI000420FC4E|nr:AAA family ATPase [Desulfogranum japonicum]
MRILTLHLRNLNSLRGNWQIDFTAPEFLANGIFAITGPTGAGKTTLLDAICLALFGATPRLGKITRSSNEIMSRSTGECFAEVEFLAGEGRYRCHWSQHRARRKPEGDLQQHKHEIVDAETGKVLETKVKEVANLVERITGLEFAQFTRSMLLAQGDFAAFLNADAAERAPILEQITGTEIYSQISVQVHERWTAEKKQTEMLLASLDSVELLTADEEESMKSRQQELQANVKSLQYELTHAERQIAYLQEVEARQRELAVLHGQLEEHHEKCEQAADDLARYASGKNAVAVHGSYETWMGIRQTVQEETKRLAVLQEQEKENLQACEKFQHQVKETGQAVEKFELHLEKELELLKQVRALDVKVSSAEKHLIEQRREYQELHKQREKQQQKQQQLICRQKGFQEKQQLTATYLEKHREDEQLVEQMQDIAGQLNRLVLLDNQQLELKQSLEKAREQRKEAVSKVETAKEQHVRSKERHAELEKQYATMHGEQQQRLAGRETPALREEIEQLRIALQAMEDARRLFGQQQELLQEQGKNTTARQLTGEKLTSCRERLESRQKDRAAREDLHEQLRINQQLCQTIADFSEARARLKPGEPCPLCGGADHPWMQKQPQVADKAEELFLLEKELKSLDEEIVHIREERARLEQAEKDILQRGTAFETSLNRLQQQLVVGLDSCGLETKPETLEDLMHVQAEKQALLQHMQQELKAIDSGAEQLQKCQAELSGLLDQLHQHANALKEAQHTVERIDDRIETTEQQKLEAKKGAQQLLEALEQQLKPFGIDQVMPENVDTVLAQLQKRRELWQEASGNHLIAERELVAVTAALDELHATLADQQVALEKKDATMGEAQLQLKALQQERQALYGERIPDAEEKQLLAQKKTLQQQLRNIQEQLQQIEKLGVQIAEKVLATGASLKKNIDQEQKLHEQLTDLLLNKGFASVELFLQALLPEAEMDSLAHLKQNLVKHHDQLITLFQEKKLALQRLEQADAPEKKVEELRVIQAQLSGQVQEVLQQVGALAEQLQRNEQAKDKQKKQLEQVKLQQQVESKWGRLHQLIGSADGKKFRMFAQGMTLDLVIHHANRHLRRMNDRYLLLRSAEQLLDLQVMDSYQAGEIRSTKNLSGGESFIVSLALSLGLSSMAGRNIRIDSLFLDEGFGSLDEEALEVALQALSELQRTGKLIGVISHVPMLQERIGVQVKVLPRSDGTSLLEGPGCRQVQ